MASGAARPETIHARIQYEASRWHGWRVHMPCVRPVRTGQVWLPGRPNQVSQAQALAAFNSPAQILRTRVELASKAARKAKALPTRTLLRGIQCQDNELYSRLGWFSPFPSLFVDREPRLDRSAAGLGRGFLLLEQRERGVVLAYSQSGPVVGSIWVDWQEPRPARRSRGFFCFFIAVLLFEARGEG